MLFELNEYPNWRELFGSDKADTRMRDIECILRFFVMKSKMVRENTSKQISLKKALNDFMGKYANASEEMIDEFRSDFINTMNKIYENIGKNAFRNYSKDKYTKKFHPAIFDAISVAVYSEIKSGNSSFEMKLENHIKLLENEEFKKVCSIRTTDIENIKSRVNLATEILIDGDDNES